MAARGTARIGERLIGSLIDDYAANDPTRVWAAIPIDDNDISQGFQDITYKQFANAINHATWWLKRELEIKNRGDVNGNPAETSTFAYAGPKDLRCAIIAVAALKLEKKLLLCSPFATVEAQNYLLSYTRASVYVHAKQLGPLVRKVLGDNSSVSTLEIPEQGEWLFGDTAPVYPYTKTWEEAYADPWLIFHTSGTTGMPRPITYTNWMMTSFDAADLMPVYEKETMCDQLRNKRLFIPLPSLHFVGMLATLQWTVFLNVVMVCLPPTGTSADQIIQTLEQGNAEGAAMTPSQIIDVLREPRGLATLRKLNYIYFVGAPLPKSAAEQLVGHVKVQPGMGSTESGAYFIDIRDEDDWEYYRFRDSMGIVMRQRTDTLYELVFKRQPQYARWQTIFHLYPNLDEYPTKDLWTRHPTRYDLWRYGGRADDLVNLLHGESLYTTPLEAIIEEHPDVHTAVVGGEGKIRPFVIIELVDNSPLFAAEAEEQVAGIWPYIERANERCADIVKLGKQQVLIADPAKPLPRTGKDTVLRSAVLALYAPEIDRLYTREYA